VPPQRRLDPRARILQRSACPAPFGMRARRIGPDGTAFIQRRFRFGPQRAGGGMVEIDTRRNGAASAMVIAIANFRTIII